MATTDTKRSPKVYDDKIRDGLMAHILTARRGGRDVVVAREAYYAAWSDAARYFQRSASKDDEGAWVCNECGSEEYTGSVSADYIDDARLSCSSCGCDEFHWVGASKTKG